MIVQSLSKDGIHQIELRHNKKYAIARGKGNWFKVFIKCLIKILWQKQ